VRIVDVGDGSYDITVNATRAATYTLYAYVGGSVVVNGQQPTTYRPGPPTLLSVCT
jgi:hypothetical protein